VRSLIAQVVIAASVAACLSGAAWVGDHKPMPPLHGDAGVGAQERSALQPLAGRIYALGSSRYAGAFAGVRITAGKIEVSVVRADDQAFLAALRRLDARGLPYGVTYVTRSYSTLARASSWITADVNDLRAEGLIPAYWNPDNVRDRVLLALQRPEPVQDGELRAAFRRLAQAGRVRSSLLPAGRSVTAGNYMAVASAVVNAQAPYSLISLQQEFVGPVEPISGPGSDERPFFAGDLINYTISNVNFCTSNVLVQIKGSGKQEVLTAAHCSNWQKGYAFYTCATVSNGFCNYNFGTVTSLYATTDDFEFIPTSAGGYAWVDDSSTTWPIVGSMDSVEGDHLTTDGYVTQVRNNELVQGAGGSSSCFVEAEGPGGGHHTVCNDVILTSPGSFCGPGDSGGPIVDVSGGNATAAGILQAEGRSGSAYLCMGQQIPSILSQASLTLVTG
jgi:hypothetical protein